MLLRIRLARPTRLHPTHVIAAGFFTLYATYSVWRHHMFQTTGYDLGIFEQAVRSYAEGRLPTSELKGPGYPLLGDHFHPVLVVLAPFYVLFPRAETLLVAQASLFALSTVPVTRLASRLSPNGAVVGVAYGFSWGIHNAVVFDFHEVCFAVPMLAFALEALVEQRWRTAVWWSLPLVLVKEDLPLTVAAIGGYLVLRGRKRLGWSVIAFGVVSFAVIVGAVLPLINADGGYAYWEKLTPSGAGIATRLGTLVALLAPTGFVALRSPLLLVAVPTLAWRFTSGNPSYWGIDFHYSAVLMPVVFCAFLAVRPTRTWVCAAVTAGFSLYLALRPLPQPEWDHARRAEAEAVLALVPDGARVAASNRLAPHLTHRAEVSLFPWHTDAEYVVVSRPASGWPVPARDEARTFASLPHHVIADVGHVVLLRR